MDGQALALPTLALPRHSWERIFPGTRDQPSAARRYLAGLLEGAPVAQDALLCLSELASNAAIHSDSRLPGGTFTVRVEAHADRVRVEVKDNGGPWAPRSASLSDGPDELPSSGRGLLIVAALADTWDITPKATAPARTAWFEIKCR